MKNYFSVKNAPLIIAICVLVTMAIVYGFNLGDFWKSVLDIPLDNINLKNVTKSIMGIYISFAYLFVLAIINQKYWFAAMCGNIFLMSGLAFGRSTSILFDGLPSNLYIIGTILEAGLAIYTILILKRYNN